MPNKLISDENIFIAKTAREVFGGKPNILTYADENNRSKIDILSCQDQPCQSVVSYSTIGLSDHSIGLEVEGIPLGVEIVGACGDEFEEFSNIISTCAFNIINSHFKCYPDAIYKCVVEMYYPMYSMKHILFIPPFGWNKEFETLEFLKKESSLVISCSYLGSRIQVCSAQSVDLLITFFEEKQINIYNLNRDTVF